MREKSRFPSFPNDRFIRRCSVYYRLVFRQLAERPRNWMVTKKIPRILAGLDFFVNAIQTCHSIPKTCNFPAFLKNVLAVFVLRLNCSRLRRDANTQRHLSEFPSASNLIIASDRHSVPLLTDPRSRPLNWRSQHMPQADLLQNPTNKIKMQPAFSLTSSANSPWQNYATCWPGSAVGITNAYGLDGPRIESPWGRDFPHLSRPALRSTQPPVQWVPGLSRG
jgi:hypothetical protein